MMWNEDDLALETGPFRFRFKKQFFMEDTQFDILGGNANVLRDCALSFRDIYNVYNGRS